MSKWAAPRRASPGSEPGATGDGQENKRQRAFDLERRLIDFAAAVLDVVESLPNSVAGVHIGGQLTRCGTSPAANYGEAQAAESRRDFIHKMKVCLKELRESRVWLEIIRRKAMARNQTGVTEAIREANELIAIFVASIATAQRNLEARRPAPGRT